MNCAIFRPLVRSFLALIIVVLSVELCRAEGAWEVTPESRAALERGLDWLEKNQGTDGNWTSNDLGLVSMGALAFLSAGHMPGRGPKGRAAQKAIDYILTHAEQKKSGLLNAADPGRDMYNHGLTTFVLGQAYGMTNDRRIGVVLDRALKLIAQCQCEDGGWDYRAARQPNGHDLSLAVMQAKALRSAVDSGLEVPPEVIQAAIRDVREHYSPQGCPHNAPEADQKKYPGQFTYGKGGGAGTIAMSAAGVVCLQEFAQYDDWRIPKSVDHFTKAVKQQIGDPKAKRGQSPLDPYTLYYVGQALYQVGGEPWKQSYPMLRDCLVNCQCQVKDNAAQDGCWEANGHVGGQPGRLYMTSVACFILAMPNRYLPILQEGKIDSLRQQFERTSEKK